MTAPDIQPTSWYDSDGRAFLLRSYDGVMRYVHVVHGACVWLSFFIRKLLANFIHAISFISFNHSFVLFPILVKKFIQQYIIGLHIRKYINNTKKMEEPAEAIGLSKAGLQWPQIIIQSKREKKEWVFHKQCAG